MLCVTSGHVTTVDLWFSAWVDEVWDLEFTQRKPFDDTIEEALSASKDKSFRTLYQCLLTHAADQQKFADSDGASQVKLMQTRHSSHSSHYSYFYVYHF